MTQRYDTPDTSGNSQNSDTEIRFDTYAAVHGTLDRVFGSSSKFGQSLGISFNDVEIEDGALYKDTDKGYYKLFSWSSVAGLDPADAADRGKTPTAHDAPEVETRTYVSTEKQYELVAARVPRIEDEDGNVVVEADAIQRDVTVSGDGVEVGDWEELGDERPSVGSTISWYDGQDEHGASAAAQRLAELLTSYAGNAVLDADDIHNWLVDDSTQNILRDDLQDRRVQFVVTTRESENGYTYHYPVLTDLETGAPISPDNSSPDAEPDSVTEAKEADTGTYPEPIADYIESGSNLQLTEERANSLLDDLISDSDNALTEEMLEDNGGRDTIVAEVL